MRAARLLLGLCCLIGACGGSDDRTLVVVSVSQGGIPVKQLQATVTIAGSTLKQPEQFPMGEDFFGLLLPPGASGLMVLDLDGLDDDGCVAAHGEQQQQIAGQGQVQLNVTLAAVAPASCTLWNQHFGGGASDSDSPTGVAVAGNGDVVMVGGFTGKANLGDGNVTSAGQNDIFVVRYGPDGKFQWERHFGGAGDDRAKAVAIDGDGSVLVAGYFSGTVSFCGTSRTSAGGLDILVLKLSADGQQCIWSQTFGGGGDDLAEAVAASSAGVSVAGQFHDAVGSLGFTSQGADDAFVLQLHPDGSYFWAERLGGTGDDSATGVAVDGSSNVFIGGYTQIGASDYQGFVAEYKPDDTLYPGWPVQFGTTGFNGVHRVATDSTGNVVVVGEFSDTVKLGNTLTSQGGSDVLLASFAGLTGTLLWARSFGGHQDDAAWGLALDSDGSIVMAGYFNFDVEFGTGKALMNKGGYDIFTARYSPQGSALWERSFGGSGTDRAWGVAIAANHGVAVAGDFSQPINTIMNTGATDVLLLQLRP